MRQGYFWPICGEDDEIVFPFAPTREYRHVEAFLGDYGGVVGRKNSIRGIKPSRSGPP